MSEIPYEVVARRAKIELRKRLRGLRNTHPEGVIAARSAKIRERLLALDVVKQAKRVALFWPIVARKEVDLRELDRTLREAGTDVFYPSIAPAEETPEDQPPRMTFRRAEPRVLEERGRGFDEPAWSADEATALDVVIVPALAADARGHRLGYGAGYYDRTLPKFAPPAKTVIVAFDFQLLAEIPITEGDVACDWIVTDARTLSSAAAP